MIFNKMVERFAQMMSRKGYQFFADGPYRLNLLFVRTSTKTNAFDDYLFCIYKTDRGLWVIDVFECTTDPGFYYRQNHLNPKGVGFVKPGQYINSHYIYLHKGKEALVQCGNVTVYRDPNNNIELEKLSEETGKGFGQNIHIAVDTEDYVTITVDKWSAMCFVLADRTRHRYFMSLCRRHRKLYGNKFTMTLLEQEDLCGIEGRNV